MRDRNISVYNMFNKTPNITCGVARCAVYPPPPTGSTDEYRTTYHPPSEPRRQRSQMTRSHGVRPCHPLHPAWPWPAPAHLSNAPSPPSPTSSFWWAPLLQPCVPAVPPVSRVHACVRPHLRARALGAARSGPRAHALTHQGIMAHLALQIFSCADRVTAPPCAWRSEDSKSLPAEAGG